MAKRAVLDSGAVSQLAKHSRHAAEWIVALRGEGYWPPVVPSIVIVESTRGHAGHHARTNRLLKGCDIVEELPERLARRAAAMRTRAGRGSAVDAVVVAIAEYGGTVLTSDPRDLRALAAHAHGVAVARI